MSKLIFSQLKCREFEKLQEHQQTTFKMCAKLLGDPSEYYETFFKPVVVRLQRILHDISIDLEKLKFCEHSEDMESQKFCALKYAKIQKQLSNH